MQEVFSKIIEELEELHERYVNQYGVVGGNLRAFAVRECIDIVEKIVKQEAEKFGTDTNVGSNGWIPVEEELPKTDEYILLSFSNFSTPLVGRYEGDEEKGGAFYIGDDDETCVSQNMYVNAWQPLPEPYLPVSNDSTDAGTRYEKSAWRALILRNFMRGSDA